MVALALGANLGEPRKTFEVALERLKRVGPVIGKSQLYETAPEGPSQPRYHNAVLLLETSLAPSMLLAAAQSIEAEAGRDRSQEQANGPRELDIDIIFYGSLVYYAASIEIPHPRAYLRRFVLKPLSEVAPGWVHPVHQKTTLELLEALGPPAPDEILCLGAWGEESKAEATG